MGNNITIGRLKNEHDVELLKTGEYDANVHALDAHVYYCIKNYPLAAISTPVWNCCTFNIGC